MAPLSPPNPHASDHLPVGADPLTITTVQGVAQTVATGTLLSQMNNAQLRNASGTLLPGEQTVWVGGPGATLTLPNNTTQVSTTNIITNNSTTATVTIAAGSGTTFNFYGTQGSFILAPGTSITVVLISSSQATPTLEWFTLNYTGFGMQVANNAVAASYTNQPTSSSTWYRADITTGTAPSITLPNDNRIYRVELLASWYTTATTGDRVIIGIGTSTAAINH